MLQRQREGNKEGEKERESKSKRDKKRERESGNSVCGWLWLQNVLCCFCRVECIVYATCCGFLSPSTLWRCGRGTWLLSNWGVNSTVLSSEIQFACTWMHSKPTQSSLVDLITRPFGQPIKFNLLYTHLSVDQGCGCPLPFLPSLSPCFILILVMRVQHTLEVAANWRQTRATIVVGLS